MPAPELFRRIDLRFPREVGGRHLAAVTVHRMTAGEVTRFVEQAAENPKAVLPMVRDETGEALSPEALEALDDDDHLAIDDAVSDFLPARLRRLRERVLEMQWPLSPSSQPNSPGSEIPAKSTGMT